MTDSFHRFNPYGAGAKQTEDYFVKESAKVISNIERLSASLSDNVIHGLEPEGFVLRPDGHLAPQSADVILAACDDNFDIESGGHIFEFRTEPITLGAKNFDILLEEWSSKTTVVAVGCELAGLHFVTRSIPLDIPEDVETSVDLFTTDPFFVEHRAYDQEVMGLLDTPFYVRYATGDPAISLKDYTLGLSLICGSHNNICFTDPNDALCAFNTALQFDPLYCALGTDGSTLGGRRLETRDSRLNLGLLRDCPLVNLERDTYLDAGLPKPLVNGWTEYTERLGSLGFMLPDNELARHSGQNYFTSLYDNLREQSWAFVKLKVFPNHRLGIEFRPLSSHATAKPTCLFTCSLFGLW